MESRGYGRTAVRGRRERIVGSALALAGACGSVAGLFGVMSPSSGGWFGLPMLVSGLALLATSLVLGSRRDARTAYRRDPWRAPEWATCALGLLPAVLLVHAEADAWPGITITQVPLDWPPLPALPTLAILAAVLVAWVTPVPPRLARARATTLPARLETA
jgi:energy-coupling factor transport system permease protein